MYMVLGGMDVFYGPLLGAFIITYLSTALQFLADWRWEVWGCIVILTMIFRPQGSRPGHTQRAPLVSGEAGGHGVSGARGGEPPRG